MQKGVVVNKPSQHLVTSILHSVAEQLKLLLSNFVVTTIAFTAVCTSNPTK